MAFSLFGKKDKNKSENAHEEINRIVTEIPLNEILPNQFQPRTVFNQKKIEELAETIASHGVIQPIVVRPLASNKYEIIAGERRYRAALHLKFETIPAIIQNYDDNESAAIALIENLQREQLSPVEEAKAYETLIYMSQMTQENLAKRVGKSQSAIANKLRLLKLPEAVKEAITVKEISERHARSLLALETEEQQITLLKAIKENHWNVTETEKHIKEQLMGILPKEKKRKKTQRLVISQDARIAINTVKRSVTMIEDSGMEIDIKEEETEDFYTITVQIPKKKGISK